MAHRGGGGAYPVIRHQHWQWRLRAALENSLAPQLLDNHLKLTKCLGGGGGL